VVFGIALVFFGFLLAAMGYALDPMVATSNSLASSGILPSSQESVDTVHLLVLMFKACSFLIPLGLGISWWAMSTRVVPGEA